MSAVILRKRGVGKSSVNPEAKAFTGTALVPRKRARNLYCNRVASTVGAANLGCTPKTFHFVALVALLFACGGLVMGNDVACADLSHS